MKKKKRPILHLLASATREKISSTIHVLTSKGEVRNEKNSSDVKSASPKQNKKVDNPVSEGKQVSKNDSKITKPVKTKNASKKNRSKQARNHRKNIKHTGKPLICPLCGVKVEPGGMNVHKESIHGEKRDQPQISASTKKGGIGVHLFQGGAPGLGKRS